MNAKKHRAIVLAITTLLSLPAPAAYAANASGSPVATSTGTIEGRVQNVMTGSYLNNARVEVKGTNARAFTDEFGRYRLTNVPSGQAMIEVVYTGMESRTIAVNVAPGQSLTQEVGLSPAGQGVVQLDRFGVEASKVMAQDVLAINEQRFAANVKTVVATGDLSEHADSNIGQFLKYIPGVSGTSAIEVRGFPPEFTKLTVDGGAIADAQLQGTSRTFETHYSMTSDNIARVEVIKMPTPSTGADTMAGSVNMISRRAFESSKASLRYQVNFTGDHEHITLEQKPAGLKEDIFYLRPSLSFVYTNPVNEKFGFVITGTYYNRWSPQDIYSTTYNVNSATFGSTIPNPMVNAANYTTAAAIVEKSAIAFNADYRLTRNSVVSAFVQTYDGQNNINISYVLNHQTGTDNRTLLNGVTGPAQGRFDATNTYGAIGRGLVQFTNNFADTSRGGIRGNVRYAFDNGDWKLDAMVGESTARTWLRNPEKGIVNRVVASNAIPVRVNFLDIDPVFGPAKVEVFNEQGQLLDVHDKSFHNYTRTESATVNGRDVRDAVEHFKLDIRKKLNFADAPMAVQIGGERRDQFRNRRGTAEVYNYNPPGGNASPLPYVADNPPLKWDPDGRSAPTLSPYAAVRAWKENPGLFTMTPAQQVTAETSRINNSEYINETADSLYFQFESRLFNNRLNLLTGVRYETTTGKGQGALSEPNNVFIRNADGSFAVNAAGARIRRPDAGAASSMEQLRLTLQERAATSNRTYGDYYPSLHLSYDITERLLARASFAQTYGRPNFTFIIPNTVINESVDAEGDVTGGTLTIRNPGLKPWTADNYELSLEYYTEQGGVLGAGVFRKDVAGFFTQSLQDATPEELEMVGLDPRDTGWRVNTWRNGGEVQVDGMELSMNVPLKPLDRWLGSWTQYFKVFANMTKLGFKGDTADFVGFIPTSANWGAQFITKRFRAALSWNYRSLARTGEVTNIGANGYTFSQERLQADINLRYNLKPDLAVFLNVRNFTNVQSRSMRRSDDLPSRAEVLNYTSVGIPFNIGVSGSF